MYKRIHTNNIRSAEAIRLFVPQHHSLFLTNTHYRHCALFTLSLYNNLSYDHIAIQQKKKKKKGKVSIDMMSTQKQDDHQRLCDFCSEAKALLYCRADTAKLCLSCDREVHATNQLFTKHTRWLLCDACDSSPVSIFCCTDNTVLCQNCDWEAHKASPSSFLGLHDRRPLDGFTGCPSVSELLGLLGLDDLGKKALFVEDGDQNGKNKFEDINKDNNNNVSSGGDVDYKLLDMFAWDSPTIVSIDELIASNDDSISGHNFQAMGMAPLPKNRNSVCGRHKDDILHQLREMSKSEPDIKDCEGCVNSVVECQSRVPERSFQLEDKDAGLDYNGEPTLVPSYETNAFKWCTNGNEVTDEAFPSTLLGSNADTNYLVPEKDSDVGDNSAHLCGGHEGSHNPTVAENLHILPKVAQREINTQERDSAISRYKEKKKTRRFDKHIRYESRKVRAESRTRINGRFAKTGHKASATQ